MKLAQFVRSIDHFPRERKKKDDDACTVQLFIVFTQKAGLLFHVAGLVSLSMPRRISFAIRLFLVSLVWIVLDPTLDAQNPKLGPDTDRAVLLIAPERVRQGDLLIAYLIGEAPLACDSALLLGQDGAIALSAPAHALTSLSAEFSTEPGASRSLPVARSQPKPRPMVYVFFIAVPTRLAQGLYRLSAAARSLKS